MNELLQIKCGEMTDHKAHSKYVKAIHITFVHLAGTGIQLLPTSLLYKTETGLTNSAGAWSIHFAWQCGILPVMASPTTSWQKSGRFRTGHSPRSSGPKWHYCHRHKISRAPDQVNNVFMWRCWHILSIYLHRNQTHKTRDRAWIVHQHLLLLAYCGKKSYSLTVK